MAELDLDFARDALGPLEHYVTIPCISPDYDATWQEAGHLERAAEHLCQWAKTRAIGDLSISIEQLPGRTPLLFCEIGATSDTTSGTVGIYGHFDKQPPLGNWSEGLEPFTPVVRNGKLFGRGSLRQSKKRQLQGLTVAQVGQVRVVQFRSSRSLEHDSLVSPSWQQACSDLAPTLMVPMSHSISPWQMASPKQSPRCWVILPQTPIEAVRSSGREERD